MDVRRPALCLVSAVALGVLCIPVGTAATDPGSGAAGSPQGANKPSLEPLLERFPIGTQPVRTTPERTPPATKPKTPAPTMRPPVQPPASSSGSTEATNASQPRDVSGLNETLWVAFVAGTGALLVLALLRARTIRAHRGTEFRGTELQSASVSASTLALFNHALAQATTERSRHVTHVAKGLNLKRHEPKEAEAEQAGEADVRAHDYAGVGERVIGILEAAEAAAAQIRADATSVAAQIRATATDEAAEIRKAAEAEASVYLERANEEAVKIRSTADADANDTRSAVESYGTQQRRLVDEQLREEVAQAESQARAIREAAEEQAKQIELAAQERGEELRAQVQPLEENMRRALKAFRGISAELEDVLEIQPREPEESLAEALSVSGPVESAR